MTSPTLPVTDFQRDQILTAAIRLTGILPYGEEPLPEVIDAAAMAFQLVLDELQSDNVLLTQRERTTQALTSGTASYTLATDTLDIEVGPNGIAGSIITAAGEAETLVTAMALHEYSAIAIKDTMAARPSRVYVEKKNTTTLVFWPVPDSSTISFRYTRIRLLMQSDTGATTMDLRRTWTPYCTFATAAQIALQNSMFEKAQMLRGWAENLKTSARSGDAERGPIKLRIRHSGRNW